MRKKIFYVFAATAFIASGIAHYANTAAWIQFVAAAVAIVFAAGLLGRATENVAHYAGERIGGFLNATFGNAAELIIALFLVKAGKFDMVKASITGSIIGNMLLVLGLSVFLGGLRYKQQSFNQLLAAHNASLMVLSAIALFIPAAFVHSMSDRENVTFSVIVAALLITAYLLWLLFSMGTHKKELSEDAPDKDIYAPDWSLFLSIVILVASTVMVAFVSDWLVHTLDFFTERFGWSELFVGAFVIAIVGNAAEHSAAVMLALKNKIGAAVEIAIGSSLQVALFVAPVLVFASYFFGQTMDIVFTIPELVAIGVSVVICKAVAADGRTNWYEGVLLLIAYVILGIAFFML